MFMRSQGSKWQDIQSIWIQDQSYPRMFSIGNMNDWQRGQKYAQREMIILMKFELEKKNYPDLAEMFLLERFNIGII